jgi:PAS domain S-box-containing protein
MPNLLRVMRPDLIPFMEKHIANRIKSGKETDFIETVIMHKKGFQVYVDVALKELETSNGRASFCIVRDITQRKLSEEALRKSERQLRFIFEKARGVICILDPSGTIINLNPAFEKTLGFSRLEWIGKPLSLLVHPEDTTIFMEQLKGATNPNDESDRKIRLMNSKNEIVNTDISATATTDEGRIDTLMILIRIQPSTH